MNSNSSSESSDLSLSQSETSVSTSYSICAFDSYSASSSYSSYTDDDSDDDMSCLALCQMISNSDERILFAKNGYRKLDKLCDTLQGQLILGQSIENGAYVAIKKACKQLSDGNIAKQDGFTFTVEENIRKEAHILKTLTTNSDNQNNNVVKFIDFFESESDYYLVTEYIEGMTLNQFVKTAQEYIHSDKLKLKHYQKIVKFIMLQLTVTLNYLHNMNNCCHLDLCAENIMLENVTFVADNITGLITVSDAITVRLVDFGVSEIFDTDFKCYKHALNIDNEAYYAPKIFDCDYFDARAADMWSLGIIFYECMTGEPLYRPTDMGLIKTNGYYAVHNSQLKTYLQMNNLLKYFVKKNSFKLLNDLLNINEQKRITVKQCLNQKYYKMYFNQIARN